MAGHSKWSNIKHKKGAADAQRAKIFTKIGREIAVSVKEGGADPSLNPKLRDIIAKAKQNNVPNDNIDRAIKKASGDGDKTVYENIVYEGYGPQGVAVIVETLTDNKNRTAADVRHAFDKFGGNLGTPGCVSYLFDDKGIIILSAEGIEEEPLFTDVMESGADDFSLEEDVYEVYTSPQNIRAAREYFESKNYQILSVEVEKIPSTTVKLEDEEVVRKMERLLEQLEESDDVQVVWENWENKDATFTE